MGRWFHRHPRVLLVVLIAVSPLGVLDVGRIVGRALRDASATAWAEASDLAREWADLFAGQWRKAFPPKEG